MKAMYPNTQNVNEPQTIDSLSFRFCLHKKKVWKHNSYFTSQKKLKGNCGNDIP